MTLNLESVRFKQILKFMWVKEVKILYIWVVSRVSVQGVESLWGDCRFIPAD